MKFVTWGAPFAVIVGVVGAVVAACTPKDDPQADTDAADTDLADTDAADTDVVDSGDTAGPQDTDDTDVVDSDGEHVVIHGQMFCELPTPSTPAGVPATPGFAKITLVQPWNCPPISGCYETTGIEVIAETTVDAEGVFDLDFQTGPYRLDELYLYTNNKDGVCGNGYQFTQSALTSYADFSDIVLDVDSIFF